MVIGIDVEYDHLPGIMPRSVGDNDPGVCGWAERDRQDCINISFSQDVIDLGDEPGVGRRCPFRSEADDEVVAFRWSCRHGVLSSGRPALLVWCGAGAATV